MTVISVQPKYGQLVGTGALDGIREYTKVFVVITDADDGIQVVGNALGLPSRGEQYYYNGEIDIGAQCRSITPRQDPENANVWEVTCQFSNDMGGGGGDPLGGDPRYDVENPLLRPPVVTWSSWSEMRVVEKDRYGKAILNTAGFPYNPPLQRRYKSRAVMIVRNESQYPIALSRNYEDSVNSDTFYGWAPGQAKLEEVTARNEYAQGVLYWSVRYEIYFRLPNWTQEVLNVGTVYWALPDAPGEEYKEVLPSDKNGVSHTNPIPLDAEGLKMDAVDVRAGRAIFNEHEIFEPKPYSALNL